jgi:hypothetical protein
VTATNYNNINKTNNFHLKSLKTKMTMKYGFENPSLGFRTGTVGCENPTPGLGQAQLVVRKNKQSTLIFTEYKKDHDIGNPGPGWVQAQKYNGVKSVNGITTPPS